MSSESRDDARSGTAGRSLAEVVAERDAIQAELDRLRAIPELRVGQRVRHALRRLRGSRPESPTGSPTDTGSASPAPSPVEAAVEAQARPADIDRSDERRRIAEPDDPYAWLHRRPTWADTRFDGIAVQIVLFENDPAQQARLAGAVAATLRVARDRLGLGRAVVRYGDCSPEPCLDDGARRTIADLLGDGADEVTFEHFGANLGSSGGSNALAAHGNEDVIWVLNPDTYPSPDAATQLLVALSVDGVGITEARQVPIEHPKEFDLGTGETPWAVGYSLMIRRDVFDEVGGFDPHYFPMYCDDVDLSWRVRLAGRSVVHVPGACVVHDKPISAGGTIRWSDDAARWSHLAKLWLYHRYGREDLAAAFVHSVDREVDPIAAEAVEIYERRVADGDAPAPLAGAESVAYFVDGRLEPRRFGYR